jgi:hypothetical protein
VVTFLVYLGAWQHLSFSWHVGEFAFFKNAYDEDSYALFPYLLHTTRLDRALSTLLLHVIRTATGGTFDAVFIIADTLLPAMAFCASYCLTAQLFRTIEMRVFWALLIVFAPDLFSLGSSTSLTSVFFPLAWFKSLFGALGETLVPPIDTSYLNILRTFEPQLAYVVGFTFAALLIRFTLGKETIPTRGSVMALTVVQCLLLTTYSPVGYPLILLELYAASILLVVGLRRRALILMLLFGISLLIVMFAASLTLTSQNFVFASRMPSISTGTIGSVLLSSVILTALWVRNLNDRTLWVAFGFAGMPALLMNQQVLSGLMVSTKDWERYINHPLLVIGAAIFCSSFAATRHFGIIGGAPGTARGLKIAAIIATSAILFFAFNSAQKTVAGWTSINVDSLAMARAIDAGSNQITPNVFLVLDTPSLAPLIAVRRGGKRGFLIDYTDVFLDLVPTFDLANFKITEHGLRMFTYWRLSGISPSEAERQLRKETASRAGFYSAFFFNICDYWYPCTDNRAVKTALIGKLIGLVIDRYRRFLSQPSLESGTRYFLVTTAASLGDFKPSFNSTPISCGAAENVKACVFSQK